MSTLPTGTVTFLFTDIAGSTRIAQEYPDAWPALQARHHALLREAIRQHGGAVFQIVGDAFCAAFHAAPDALAAAVNAQRALQREPWSPAPIQVRIGIHTGMARAGATDPVAGGYTGYSALARAQRVMSTAHAEQILLSGAAAELLRGELPTDITLRDMGEHRLKGILNPERLWQVVAPDLRQDFPALATLNAIPNNLPVQLTSFVGREEDIVQVTNALRTARLVTLTGSGGTGKTRLSLQVAASILDLYKDGAWFVELAPLSDPELVPLITAGALGLRVRAGQPATPVLSDYLREKQLLLILDNCEHLLAACAALADTLLRACPDLRILASSREPLGIAGELAWRVPSLPAPDPQAGAPLVQLEQYAAVRLFVERAVFALPAFQVTNANAPAVAQICWRLDGIPLAIELAAARVKVLPAEKIAERLDDRFRLLTGGSRTAPPRQQTLRAAIDWSYDLLPESERVLFRRLAVFAGGWTLEAAEEVCASLGDPANTRAGAELLASGEVLDALTRLIDKSLVVADAPAGEARYHMLETVRQYAAEKLAASGEEPATAAAHAAWYLQLAEAGEAGLKGHAQRAWVRRLLAEQDNFREALRWAAAAADSEVALRLGAALWPFWERHENWNEGIPWLQLVVALPGGTPGSRARAMMGLAYLRQFTWTATAEALAMLEATRDLARAAGDAVAEAKTLVMLGRVWAEQKDFATGLALMREAAALARAAGDRWTLAWILFWIGWDSIFAGYTPEHVASARAAWHESLELYTACGDALGRAEVLSQLALLEGMLATDRAGYLAAVERATEAIAVFRDLNNRTGLVRTLSMLGEIARYHGDYARAQAAYEQAYAAAISSMGLAPMVNLGNQAALAVLQEDWRRAAGLIIRAWPAKTEGVKQGTVAFMLVPFGGVFALRGQPHVAVTLLAAAQAVFDSLGAQLQPPDQQVFDRVMARAQAGLSEAELAESWARGRALSMQQAYDYGRQQLGPALEPATGERLSQPNGDG